MTSADDKELNPYDFCILLTGKNTQGRAFYAYLAVTRGNMDRLQERIAEGRNFRPEEMGKILYWNYGEAPPPEVAAHMERQYGVNHRFEAELTQALEEIAKDA